MQKLLNQFRISIWGGRLSWFELSRAFNRCAQPSVVLVSAMGSPRVSKSCPLSARMYQIQSSLKKSDCEADHFRREAWKKE